MPLHQEFCLNSDNVNKVTAFGHEDVEPKVLVLFSNHEEKQKQKMPSILPLQLGWTQLAGRGFPRGPFGKLPSAYQTGEDGYHRWSRLSVAAHLLDGGADARQIKIWKVSLTRAVAIMNMHDLHEERANRRQPPDLKGHVLATSLEGDYCFCSRCFVTSKSRDRK